MPRRARYKNTMSGDSEFRSAISSVLAAHPPQALFAAAPPVEESAVLKAGILPFLPAATMENWRVCLMKPVAVRPEKGAPPFQLAKGTRMRREGKAWADIASGHAGGEAESLAETALREGVEELGLDIRHIRRLFDAGPVCFASVKTGAAKWLWLYAAEMHSQECFLPAAALASTTAARRWMTLAECRREGRDDHVSAIECAVRRLERI